MASYNVADFAAKFGLKTDKESFLSAMFLVEGLKAGLRAMGSVVREVTHQLVESTFGVYEQTDALAKMSQRVGVAAGSLQELGYAGKLSDVSLESLGTGFKFLNKNIVDAVQGSKELKDAFKAAKVQLTDNGKLRSTEEVFNDLATRFAAMPDSAAKSALAMKIFGKSGADLLPLLNEGADGLAELRQEFRELHGTTSEDFFEKAQQFNDDVDRVKTGFDGLKQTFAEAVLPTLQELVGSTLEWVRANRELISAKIREWVQNTVKAIREFIRDVRQWIDEQGGLNAVLEKAEHWLKMLGLAFAVFKTVEFVGSIGKAIDALKAIKLAIMSNPLGLLAVLMATAVTMWVENWDYMKEFFLMIWDGIVGGIDAAVKAVGDAIDWVVGKVTWAFDKVQGFIDWANPFNIEDTSTSGVRGVPMQNPVIDAAIAMSRNPALGVTAPQLVERGTGGGSNVSVSAPMSIAITQQPGQDPKHLAQLVGATVDEHLNRTMREARGGL